MKFHNEEHFVGNVLPTLIKSSGHNHVVICTYNAAGIYDGKVIDDERLSINVIKGDLSYSRATDGLFSPDIDRAMAASYAMQREAECAQIVVENVYAQSEVCSDAIFFIYAGLSAFERSVKFAQNVRRDFSNACVVLITCDCDLDEKKQALQSVANNISHVVVTDWCGGDGTLERIIDRLIGDE